MVSTKKIDNLFFGKILIAGKTPRAEKFSNLRAPKKIEVLQNRHWDKMKFSAFENTIIVSIIFLICICITNVLSKSLKLSVKNKVSNFQIKN